MSRPALLALLLLAGCDRPQTERPDAQVQAGIDRSVADVRAADAAAATPLPASAPVPAEKG